MRVVSFAAAGLGVVMSFAASGTMAQGGLSGLQGAWLSGSAECADVYSSSGKGTTFKKPVDIFAPAFIISGNSLKTPQASCRIKSSRPGADHQLLVLNCTNAVAGNEVRAFMTLEPDGSLRRYLNELDTTGTAYKRCSR